MERTMTVIIFFTLTIVGAALIIAFVAQSRVDPFCATPPECAQLANGETFCADNGLSRCVIADGCMRLERQACDCAAIDGVAQCVAP